MVKTSICWCGSEKLYSDCHEEFDYKLELMKENGDIIPDHSLIRNEKDIVAIRKSATINSGLLDFIAANIKVGMTTEELDILAYNYTLNKGAIPAPLGYGGFPKSICTSINDVVCHGIPKESDVLKEGDILNVDVSTIYKGYFSDASRMFIIGAASEEAKKLVKITRECLEIGIAAIKPWGYVGDIGAAIAEHAHKHGYGVVVDLAGHGIGKEFHEEPSVFHVGTKGKGMVLAPGMTFTVEPMINQKSHKVFVDANDGWTVYTEDGMLSAQWEHMILVTKDGVEILSA